MHTKKVQWSIGILCLILGIMFAIQYKATSFYEASLLPPRIEDLTAQLNSITNERNAVEQKVASLNQQSESIRNNDKLMARLQKKLQSVKMAGGLYPVQGPGICITITITKSPTSFQMDDSNNGSFEEAFDLLILINELKASGAEAISINDERITAMSEIYWTGTMIVVNEKPIKAPYRILAIGDCNNLEKGMSLTGGYLYYLKFRKQIELKKVNQITMPAFNGSTQMNFARQVK